MKIVTRTDTETVMNTDTSTGADPGTDPGTNPVLSIVIVNWNTERLLRDCLASVHANPPAMPFEIIVVDNASGDGSRAMVRRDFPQVRLIACRENLGFAAANNIGFGAAAGRYILLLNSDTLIHGDVLAASVRYLDRHDGVGAMGCRVLNADGTLQHSTSQFPGFLNLLLQTLGLDRVSGSAFLQRYRMKHWQRDTAQAVDTVSGCYMLVRRACMAQVGLLDERFFFFGEETDWCRRMAEAGWAVHFAPVGTITHFGGGSSGTLNHRRDLMLTQATVRLHLKHSGLAAALAVFLLLFVFNGSRIFFWALRGLATGQRPALRRARFFLDITSRFLSAWPRRQGRMI
ncbi:glycosyltransferase family 2 protein [Eilatimonas milleporae]|nr:glycosyltransferase family 2 protein [Eilatimonas milleporae]